MVYRARSVWQVSVVQRAGKRRSGTVYLAYHVELEELQGGKSSPEIPGDYDTFRKEALFLKTLRHPESPSSTMWRKIPDTVI